MKEFIASIVLIAIGLVVIVGEQLGISALSGWVIRDTIPLGPAMLVLGIGTGIFNWFNRDKPGKDKKDKKKQKTDQSATE